MTETAQRDASPLPPIIPLQRTLVRRVVQVFSAIMLLWFGVYLGLNDRTLGRLVSKIVTSQVRGTFTLGYAHYDYWSSLGSLILNTPAPVYGGDFELRDPNNEVVMRVRRVEARMYIGELIRGLIRSAVSAPFGRGVFIELHMAEGRVRSPSANVHPIELPRPPGTVVPPLDQPYTEVNIVATMSSRKPKPEDAPPSPGHVRIVIDGAGVNVEDGVYEMAFPGWHGKIEGIRGTATLRYSSDAAETRPGRVSFFYEVSPLTGERGTLVLGTPEGAGEFVFPLQNLALRRFGARANRKQDLFFRGQMEVAGAAVEVDGSLVDTYCDPGVNLQMSFEHGAGLALLVPGKMLKESGSPHGRVRFFGPFSAAMPQTPRGRPAPCLSEPWHISTFPSDPVDRTVAIEGQVGGVEAEVATINIHDAGSPFRLGQGELHLAKVVGSALGGEVRAEPMKISFLGDMPWSARVSTVGVDPAQVVLVPPFLRPFVVGKMRGGFRVSGHLGKKAHPERVAIDRVEATLERLANRDPLPRELKVSGSFLYTPEQLGWHNVHVTGDTLALETERGHVGIETGRLEVPVLDLRGKGGPMSRILQSLGVDATVDEASASMRLGGRLSAPEVLNGEAAVSGFDLSGRRLTDVTTSFGLHDGTLSVSDLAARGPLGTVRGEGSVRVFFKNLSNRPADPAITLNATVEQLNLEAWNKLLPISGFLDGQASLEGTLNRPTGTLAARVPLLPIQDGRFRDVSIELALAPEAITMKSLYAALGAGLLSGTATLRRDGDRPVDLTLKPYQLPLRDLPGARRLPFLLDGTMSGQVRVLGGTAPLAPRLDGRLQFDGISISGRSAPSPLLPPSAIEITQDVEPLFTLLGMAVRTLTLNQGELTFNERPDGGTQVRGTLFGAFDVDGLVYLNPLRPRGEVSVRFGCPATSVVVAGGRAPAPAPADRSLACDLLVSKLLPDLHSLGEVSVTTSGVLTLRFGEDPRGLFMHNAVAANAAAASCPQLGSRPLPEQHVLGLPLAATLRLGRALLEVHTVDEDGEDQRYRVHNRGDVLLCTDGRSMEMGQVQFVSQRQSSHQKAAGQQAATELHPMSSGLVTLSGIAGPDDTNLHILGQLQLELLEDVLRSTFRHTHGEARVDMLLTGKPDDLKVTGWAELQKARLVPHAIDTPIDVSSGRLALQRDKALLQRLRATVDGATTEVNGSVEVQSWTPLRVGKIDFTLAGDLSARLLQWQFAHNLAEARGSLGLRQLHVTGTLPSPEVEGTLVAKDLFLNLRRFHELMFTHGTLAFSRGKGGSGRIVVGCPSGAPSDCEPLIGTVDGDGKAQINGRIDHSGLGQIAKPNWYQALDNVRAAVLLENVRHTQAGVYNVEVTTPEPGLQLVGDRDEMRLLGNVEVVSGRYMQDFDLSERFLSARRVVEEETPFWEGDPFLSSLTLGLRVRTRGTFRVYNNIADLRLATTDFTVGGPLESVAMGGVIRVESGYFYVPGLRSEFEVRGDSKIDFSSVARWPETPWVDVRGSARELDQNDQQRNIELALRGRVKELRIECLSSESMSATDCASFLLLGDPSSDPRSGSSATASSTRPLQYGDPAAKLLSSQLLTNQVADPLRQKLRLDTVRIQFGVSTFDVQLCKRFGLYLRMCGLAEWGVFGNAGNRYRGFGELQMSDLTVGQISLERIERGFSFLTDTINRFKVQAGFKLPLRY